MAPALGLGYHRRQQRGGVSMAGRWYEDFEVGEEIRSPSKTMTEAEIVQFAFLYDPQPFHIDKPTAEASIYGGLIASGWHLTAVAFRLLMQAGVLGEASLGSPGIDELRWLQPVRPGDTITTVVEIAEKRLSRSKPDRGIVIMDYRIVNQDDEAVMTMRGIQLIRRRET
jgi:acyl dehydratase